MLFSVYYLWIYVYLVSYTVYSRDYIDVQCKPQDQTLEYHSSERKDSTLEFNAKSSDIVSNKLNCSWFIRGIVGNQMNIVLNEISIAGSCVESTFTVYEGDSDSGRMIKSKCGGQSSTSSEFLGYSFKDKADAYITFISDNAAVGDKFKITFKSTNDISEPFEDGKKADVGIILAIVLGIVFLGSMFIALTYCSVKTYMRCRYRDPEPSELTSITNLRAERMREITMKDDFDTPPVMRIGRTLSTDKFVREAYA